MTTQYDRLMFEQVVTEHVIRDAELEIRRIDREIRRLEDRKVAVTNEIYRRQVRVDDIKQALGGAYVHA